MRTLLRLCGTLLLFAAALAASAQYLHPNLSKAASHPISLSSHSAIFLSSRSEAKGSAFPLNHPGIPRNRLLPLITNPDLAVLLLITGIFFIYTEFNIPGTVIPGALGTFMVLLALFGLSLLPIRPTAATLAIAGFLLLLLEFKLTTHGILALLGTAALTFGLATLIDSPLPELQVHTSTALAAGLSCGLISSWLAWIALRARRNKVLLGPDAMIGKLAIARTPLRPSGQIEVRGEIWQATLADPTLTAPLGAHLLIREAHGLQLTVDIAE